MCRWWICCEEEVAASESIDFWAFWCLSICKCCGTFSSCAWTIVASSMHSQWCVALHPPCSFRHRSGRKVLSQFYASAQLILRHYQPRFKALKATIPAQLSYEDVLKVMIVTRKQSGLRNILNREQILKWCKWVLRSRDYFFKKSVSESALRMKCSPGLNHVNMALCSAFCYQYLACHHVVLSAYAVQTRDRTWNFNLQSYWTQINITVATDVLGCCLEQLPWIIEYSDHKLQLTVAWI